MLDIVWGTSKHPELNRKLADWAAEKIWPGQHQRFGNCKTLGILDGEKLLYVCVYHNFNPHAGVIEMSGASVSKRYLTRRTLKAIFSYPFTDAGCQMAVMRVSANDKPLARMLTSYGFKSYLIPRLRGRDEDEIIFTLTDDDWKTNKFNRRDKAQGR